MHDSVKIISKKPEINKKNLTSQRQKTNFSQSPNSSLDHILFLQKTIGNQAMQRMIKSGVIQTKLRIGQPNDIYEQEADRIAEEIGSSQWSVVNSQKEEIQRQVEEEEEKKREEELVQPKLETNVEHSIQRQAEEEKEEILQTKEMQSNILEVTPDFESRIHALKGGGQPLPKSIRAFFEPRFGYDFSQVRIHNDSEGAKLARALNARAFTIGRDIVFGAGEYLPITTKGQQLLAHELTHVIQQTSSTNMSGRLTLIQRESEDFFDTFISISYDIPLIPQPTNISCWAAALAMIVSYRDNTTYTPEYIASYAGMNINTGYGWSDIRRAVFAWGLFETAPMSAMPDYWASLLETHGPLWIVEVGAPYHAVVVAGMYGTGSPDATEVWIYNPWPPNQGAIEYKTFMDFDTEFGLGAGANAAIVHA